MSVDGGTLRFVVQLDVDLIALEDAVDFRTNVLIAGRKATLTLPGGDKAHDRVVAPTGFEHANANWGYWTSRSPSGGQFAATSLGFEFSLDASESTIAPKDLPTAFAKGVGPVEVPVLAWVGQFTNLTGHVLRQALSPADPSPKMLNRPNDSPLKWVEREGYRSWVDSSPTPRTVSIESALTPLSERPADAASLARLVNLCTDALQIPSAVLFVSAARLAALRSRSRVAIMELGTAAEALFTDVLGLGNHKMTLGVLVDHVQTKGFTLPAGVKADFVEPRNRAVHKGVDPTDAQVLGAMKLLDQLIAAHYPDFACDPALPAAHRPQRMDLVIATPAGSSRSGAEDRGRGFKPRLHRVWRSMWNALRGR